jgi:hypothetical protein
MAYNSGDWTGNGITSSWADADTQAIGYAEASELSTIPAIFGGGVDDTSVLIRLTRYGDADLDGDVDLDDVGKWSLNFTGELGGAGSKLWHEGDWDYDGDVDLDDVGKWSLNFTGELGGGAGGSAELVLSSPIHAAAASALRSLGIAVVPEPGSLITVAGLGSAIGSCFLRRNRRPC